ncbi:MAG: hypothetical protein WAU17_06455, partial [Nitrospirales bacterium]
FRLSIKTEASGLSSDFKLYNESRGWALRPGNYRHFNFRAFREVDFTVNEDGLRNHKFSLALPADRERVTILGDSFVFGEALNDGEHLTDQLQKLGAGKFEFINVSAPGYGTGQEILLIKELVEHGYQIGNKLILAFFTNDILDNLGLDYSLKRSAIKPVFTINKRGELDHSVPEKPEIRKTSINLFEKSLFFHFVRSRIEILLAANSELLDYLEIFGIIPDLPRVPGIITGWYNPGWEERWALTRDLLTYLAKLTSNEYQAKLFVLFIPSPFQSSGIHKAILSNKREKDPRYETFLADIERPQNLLRKFCEEQGIPFIDASPALQKNGTKIPMFFPREGHLNEHGSQVVAELIYRSIKETP